MKRFVNRMFCVALSVMALLGSAKARAEEAGKTRGSPTFNRDVAPLVFKNCAARHLPLKTGRRTAPSVGHFSLAHDCPICPRVIRYSGR